MVSNNITKSNSRIEIDNSIRWHLIWDINFVKDPNEKFEYYNWRSKINVQRKDSKGVNGKISGVINGEMNSIPAMVKRSQEGLPELPRRE